MYQPRVSELIAVLQNFMQQYGDIPVKISHDTNNWKWNPDSWEQYLSVDTAMSSDNDLHYELILSSTH